MSQNQITISTILFDHATMDDANAYGGSNGGLAKRYVFIKQGV